MSRGEGAKGTAKSSYAPLPGRKVTDRFSIMEFNDLISYNSTTLGDDDQDYYEQCKNDLRFTLLVTKGGVRVRDIRSQFRNNAGYEVDFKRLGLKDWGHFLLSCRKIVDFKLDSKEDKETLYAFVSAHGLREIHTLTRDMQSMINCTPDDKDSPSPYKLVPMEAREAYMKGFLEPADGVPFVDPRVPIQKMGVAAAETMRRIQNQKLSFDEQIALSNRPKKSTMTLETTGPLPETVKSDAESVMSWLDELNAEPSVSIPVYDQIQN